MVTDWSESGHPDDPLLTLKEASDRLGVHPATLRRWADRGDLAIVMTPGGHRRFPATEIERLRTQTVSETRMREVNKKWAVTAIHHTRQDLHTQDGERWLTRLDAEDRAEKRTLGRRLMGLMMQYISAEDDKDEAILTEARGIGLAYAESTRRSGLEMVEALEATMFFRDHLVESALLLPETTRLRPEANQRLLRRINTFLNVIQIAIAEAYEAN